MQTLSLEDITISRLEKNKPAPWSLLLLADPYEGAVKQYLAEAEVYTAMLHGSCIGVYVLYALSTDTTEIKNIAVEEAYQGKGVGKRLLAHAAHTAKSKHFKNIIIGTGNSSVGQLFLYQHQGFEIFDLKKNFFLDNYPEAIFEDGIQCKHMIMLRKEL